MVNLHDKRKTKKSCPKTLPAEKTTFPQKDWAGSSILRLEQKKRKRKLRRTTKGGKGKRG